MMYGILKTMSSLTCMLILALRMDDVSVHVSLSFPTIENARLKSLESQLRFACPHFGSINSNCELRY